MSVCVVVGVAVGVVMCYVRPRRNTKSSLMDQVYGGEGKNGHGGEDAESSDEDDFFKVSKAAPSRFARYCMSLMKCPVYSNQAGLPTTALAC